MRLTASAAVKEKRLAALAEGRDGVDALLRTAVENAQARGSVELAQAQGALAGPEAEARAKQAVLSALRAYDPAAPLTAEALLVWQRALTGHEGFRRQEGARPEGPPPAPVPFIASRLGILEQWMEVSSTRELSPSRQGALVLARVAEILPFEEANGRIARLAASHVVVRAGGRPPVLTGADATRLAAVMAAAFRLDTEPLATLYEEASERALDVMLAALER